MGGIKGLIIISGALRAGHQVHEQLVHGIESAHNARTLGFQRRSCTLCTRPRFHERDCLIIKGQNAQPVALDQAAEDGFKPCSLCQRNR